MAFEDRKQLAAKVLEVLELTQLADDTTEEDVRRLCERADTEHGPVAAVCVPQKFVMTARQVLGKRSPIAVCTVANWPRGRSKVDYVVAETEIAFFEGASEVNMVVPWRQFRSNDQHTLPDMVEGCVRMSSRRKFVKATLEAGALEEDFIIREAARQALDSGAEFLEADSGHAGRRCTLDQVRALLEEIRDHRVEAGLKVGPVSTLDECRPYLQLAAEVMGEDWIDPENFRIGGKEPLLDEILEELSR